jgi:hypothetical protein
MAALYFFRLALVAVCLLRPEVKREAGAVAESRPQPLVGECCTRQAPELELRLNLPDNNHIGVGVSANQS